MGLTPIGRAGLLTLGTYPPSRVLRLLTAAAELWHFPAAPPGVARSDGTPDPTEECWRAIDDRLWTLRPVALPALNRGLADPDVQIRRKYASAFFPNVAGDTWSEPSRPRLDIRPCLKALMMALSDTDVSFRPLAAQAVGAIGPEASSAVPALVALLASLDEGSRNSALIGLTKIGPAARDALRQMQRAQ